MNVSAGKFLGSLLSGTLRTLFAFSSLEEPAACFLAVEVEKERNEEEDSGDVLRVFSGMHRLKVVEQYRAIMAITLSSSRSLLDPHHKYQ